MQKFNNSLLHFIITWGSGRVDSLRFSSWAENNINALTPRLQTIGVLTSSVFEISSPEERWLLFYRDKSGLSGQAGACGDAGRFCWKDFTNSSGYYLNQISFYLKTSIHCGLLGSSRLNEPIFNDWPKPFVVRVQHLSLTLYKQVKLRLKRPAAR